MIVTRVCLFVWFLGWVKSMPFWWISPIELDTLLSSSFGWCYYYCYLWFLQQNFSHLRAYTLFSVWFGFQLARTNISVYGCCVCVCAFVWRQWLKVNRSTSVLRGFWLFLPFPLALSHTPRRFCCCFAEISLGSTFVSLSLSNGNFPILSAQKLCYHLIYFMRLDKARCVFKPASQNTTIAAAMS